MSIVKLIKFIKFLEENEEDDREDDETMHFDALIDPAKCASDMPYIIAASNNDFLAIAVGEDLSFFSFRFGISYLVTIHLGGM